MIERLGLDTFWEDYAARTPRERDQPYMGWVAKLPCIGCLARRGVLVRGVQVAHCRAAYPEEGIFWRSVGKQEKPHDRRTTPLCPDCHLNGRNAQHRMNEELWWDELGVYPPEFCAALIKAYDTGQGGFAVVAHFAALAKRRGRP